MKRYYMCFGRIALAIALASSVFPLSASVALPYLNDFATQARFDEMAVKDVDEDLSTWHFDFANEAAVAGGVFGTTPDDWMWTPEFHFVPGIEYRVSFSARSEYDSYRQEFKLLLGGGLSPENYSTAIGEPVVLTLAVAQDFSFEFTVGEEGDYRLAFNLYGSAPFYGAVVDDLKVEALADFAAPAAPGLKAAAAPDGVLKAEVEITVPNLTYGGEALSSVTSVELRRDGILLHTFSEPTVGEVLTYADDDEALEAGLHTYQAVAFSSLLEGMASSCTLWLGEDTPLPPSDFFAIDNLDGSINFEWLAPTVGVNGGYVPSSSLTFNLYQYKEGEFIPLGSIPAGKVEATFDLGEQALVNQQMVTFGLSAVSTDMGESYIALSNEYIIGVPYELPFAESFPGGYPVAGLWVLHTGKYNWESTSYVDYDGDGGAIYFSIPGDESTPATNSIESGKFNIRPADNPSLVFRYLAYPGSDVQLRVLVRKDGGKNYETAWSVDYMQLDGDEEWRTAYLSLSDYKDSEYVTVSFDATVADSAKAAVVDAIEVRHVNDIDLAINFVGVPAKVVAGNSATVDLEVKNLGLQPAVGAIVTLYANDDEVSSKTVDVAAFSTEKMQLSFPTSVVDDAVVLHANVVLQGDADLGNNDVLNESVVLVEPTYPTVSDLGASVAEDNSVVLTWTAVQTEVLSVTDDFESYEAFTITDFGDWSTYDVDGLPSTTLGGDYPHRNEVFPYIIFNPVALGFPVDDSAAAFKAHSGDQYLAAISGNGKNDDWFVSPRLSGDAQTVKLFARSYNVTYGCEQFEVLYSATGDALDDFVSPEGEHAFEVPAEWTEYSVDLPEGAKYFAIRYVSDYVWMLMIDDVTYVPAAMEVSAYNIYRDGQKIGTADVAEYVDVDVPEGSHNYNVTVLYDGAKESALSNVAVVDFTGVENVVAEFAGSVEIYDINGRCLFIGDAHMCPVLSPGVYVVKTAMGVAKMLVR